MLNLKIFPIMLTRLCNLDTVDAYFDKVEIPFTGVSNILLLFARIIDFGTLLNHINEAVLMTTHNLCFELVGLNCFPVANTLGYIFY